MNISEIELRGLIESLQNTPRTPQTPRTEIKKSKNIIPWSKTEDEQLRKGVEKYGIDNWEIIAESFPQRTKKQCKERYHNHLDPNITRKAWTEEEDNLMLMYRQQFGNKWSEITKYIPGRTANQIKNRFFSHFAEHMDENERKLKKKKGCSSDSNGSTGLSIQSVFVPSNTEYSVIQNSPRYY